MKYKGIGIAAAVLALLCALAATALEAEEGPYRVHQHLESRGPDGGCDCGGTELCTHLPLVIIGHRRGGHPRAPIKHPNGTTTYTTTSTGESMLPARIAVMDDETRNHHPSDEPDLETDTLIRIRGNSSRSYDKKSYLLRFTDEKGEYEDHEVMGMDAHYEVGPLRALSGQELDPELYVVQHRRGDHGLRPQRPFLRGHPQRGVPGPLCDGGDHHQRGGQPV